MNWKSHFNNRTNNSGHHMVNNQVNLNTRRRCIRVSLDSQWATNTLSMAKLGKGKSLTISRISEMLSAIKIRYPTNSLINRSLKLVKAMLTSYRSSSWTRPLLKNQSHLSSEVSQRRHIRAIAVHSLTAMEFKLTHKCQIWNNWNKNLNRKI